jgi:hypothetical protein
MAPGPPGRGVIRSRSFTKAGLLRTPNLPPVPPVVSYSTGGAGVERAFTGAAPTFSEESLCL